MQSYTYEVREWHRSREHLPIHFRLTAKGGLCSKGTPNDGFHDGTFTDLSILVRTPPTGQQHLYRPGIETQRTSSPATWGF